MRLCSFRSNNRIVAGVIVGDEVLSITRINRELGIELALTVEDLIARKQLTALRNALGSIAENQRHGLSLALAPLCTPYPTPRKIWGVSSNDWTTEHPAARLPAAVGFLKPTTALIGPHEPIVLPPQVTRASGEVALGIILGQTCTRLSLADAPQAVLGFTTLLDMTAVELVQHAPLLLGSAKSFDTSLSQGPWIVTPEDMMDFAQRTVSLWRNGELQHTCYLADLPATPYDMLVTYSATMTWHSGDILFCSLPGMVFLQPGDHVACEISGMGVLENFVAAVPPPLTSEAP